MIINIVFGLILLGWLIAIIWAFNKIDSLKERFELSIKRSFSLIKCLNFLFL